MSTTACQKALESLGTSSLPTEGRPPHNQPEYHPELMTLNCHRECAYTLLNTLKKAKCLQCIREIMDIEDTVTACNHYKVQSMFAAMG